MQYCQKLGFVVYSSSFSCTLRFKQAYHGYLYNRNANDIVILGNQANTLNRGNSMGNQTLVVSWVFSVTLFNGIDIPVLVGLALKNITLSDCTQGNSTLGILTLGNITLGNLTLGNPWTIPGLLPWVIPW